MKTKHIFLLTLVTVIVIWGCSKKNDSSNSATDYAANASGTYTGYVLDSILTTVIAEKQSSSTIILHLKIPGFPTIDYPNIGVSDGGNENILLAANGNETYPFSGGTVKGKTLDCYFKTLHFIGIKP
jgi:hypothetical protein